MKRRWAIILIPAFILIVSIGIMTGGNFLKKPMAKDDRLLEAVQQLEKNVKNKEWGQAEERAQYAGEAWKKIVNRIQFSVEREYMFEITGALSRIKGGVKAKDDQAVMEEIYFFYDLFDSLGR